ncbi:hypothetical protein BBO99_00003677 [Phytophthora kernoviae]|uniref:Uncharacterized protein n=2 Tax=Phytophthora kernoviae TaxID=325452 RepID=A0A3R7GJW2_9STRA|nr:hypothetical protein G195_006091 [Phytophthora kernoviae 00238/432]KAG2523499.1 hypothetical protein JM16_002266 [Phytophthora kernoviae]KAG2525414.1 hypothetical protein JM18_002346 [Phytophthora kernoviae]RLN10488.1 hypothetical protein BBI17_003705 [Phytophthora kernoviae]RLN81471.1 hypothetical protein BBO99_00003677 [Phytophthora kernoviae]
MKVRNGVSLSDLKAEHREALQMLKELGGPVDPDYQQADMNAPHNLLASNDYRMYDDDCADSDDEDINEGDDNSTGVKETVVSGDGYSDEDFEGD